MDRSLKTPAPTNPVTTYGSIPNGSLEYTAILHPALASSCPSCPAADCASISFCCPTSGLGLSERGLPTTATIGCVGCIALLQLGRSQSIPKVRNISTIEFGAAYNLLFLPRKLDRVSHRGKGSFSIW